MKPTGDSVQELHVLKNLLSSAGLRPRHYLGQNFLVDSNVVSQILEVAGLNSPDTVVEIGSGVGNLTKALAGRVKKVIAIEKDSNLIPLLKQSMVDSPNVEIVNQDALKYNFSNLKSPFKIVGNIPYYLTSHLIQVLLSVVPKPELIILMVQKEVAQRITASRGELTVLGISVQISADVELAALVSKDSFWPKPKVDSAILLIEPKNKYPEIDDQRLFFRIVKAAFAGKRKQIHNTLASGLNLDKDEIIEILARAGLDPRTRPQDLSILDWIKLYQIIQGNL